VAFTSICSGTLVTVDDILTSAHCFTSPFEEFGSAIVGFAVFVGGANGQLKFITNFAIHPFYNGQAGSPYDIAMATLDSIPSPAIGPVPLLLSELTEVGQRASTFGYGTNNQGEIGLLKSAELIIERFVGGNIYASTAESGASICQGDSGGPLVQVVNGVSSLVGVNSFGDVSAEQCAASGGSYSGFVDLQNINILDFIFNYAPDVPAN
jgi:secreted trypsin-like serine protease